MFQGSPRAWLWHVKYVAVALLVGCASEPPCYEANSSDYTAYSIVPHRISPVYRIPVDDSNNEVDLTLLDNATKNVLNCLAPLTNNPLTEKEKAQGYCYGAVSVQIKQCLAVKVPSDWYVSKCTGKELFPCAVPNISCEVKGETPTQQCPCACRAIIQDNTYIITAPNLELYPGRLTQIMTSCNNPWAVPRIAECANPSMVAY